MSDRFSRRDFIKILGLASAGVLLPYHLIEASRPARASSAPNILIVVFDAWSAQRCSLYGHTRPNTPNLERLAARAVVYHNHISGGNFTLPGTASLLTGMLPWRHRVFDLPVNPRARHYADATLFGLFDDYHRFAYTHNPLAELLLRPALAGIDDYTARYRLMLDGDSLVHELFAGDSRASDVAWMQTMKSGFDPVNYSLFFSRIYEEISGRKLARFSGDYPLGVPRTDTGEHFLLEAGIDFAVEQAAAAAEPFLGYLHFLPPHLPYRPPAVFHRRFDGDGYALPEKPGHPFSQEIGYERLAEQAARYDEFILYVDEQFDRLHAGLERFGRLENTWIFLTSDHGELFERGILGHSTPALFQPVVHIPLVVFPPGRTYREDVFKPTSAVDLLPTLLQIAGKADRIPDRLEGRPLPPFASDGGPFDVFAVEAQETKPNDPMRPGTVALHRDHLKLIYYFGYPELGDTGELVEVYDLEADPEETRDLYADDPGMWAEMLETVKQKIAENDAPFQTVISNQ